MKKILCLFLLWPSLALAHPQACINSKELTQLTNQYRELPFVRGVSIEGYSVVIFANAETRSFTILERKDDDIYCALTVGAGFEPVPQSIQDELNELQNRDRL